MSEEKKQPQDKSKGKKPKEPGANLFKLQARIKALEEKVTLLEVQIVEHDDTLIERVKEWVKARGR